MSSIELDSGARTTGGMPVVKSRAIGDKFVGAIVKTEQRDMTKMVDGVYQPVLKPNGKARQELVVTCVTMPKSACKVGLGDDEHDATAGETVRLIIKGLGFKQWIDARKTHRGGRLLVGDVVVQTITHAIAYDASGQPKGGEITDQAVADALPRGTSVGFYGPLTLHEPKDNEWVDAAQAAYRSATAVEAAPSVADDEPF